MKIQKNYKEDSGVTLIVLTIIIIVIMILASVSVAALTGKFGILSKSTEAKNTTETGQIKEIIMEKWYEFEKKNIGKNYSDEEKAAGFQAKLNQEKINAVVTNETNAFRVVYNGDSERPIIIPKT